MCICCCQPKCCVSGQRGLRLDTSKIKAFCQQDMPASHCGDSRRKSPSRGRVLSLTIQVLDMAVSKTTSCSHTSCPGTGSQASGRHTLGRLSSHTLVCGKCCNHTGTCCCSHLRSRHRSCCCCCSCCCNNCWWKSLRSRSTSLRWCTSCGRCWQGPIQSSAWWWPDPQSQQ
jgi:hypothetical protein